MSDVETSRREVLKAMAAGGALLLIRCSGAPKEGAGATASYDWNEHYWGYAIDISKCIGCCSCMRACKAENDVPDGNARTWIERYNVHADGEVSVDAAMNEDFVFGPGPEDAVRSFFIPKMCNHCEKSVCSQVCPVGAAYQTVDGVVLVDKDRCVGCGYCVQACPYGTRYIHPEEHVADKCTLCYHRITKGLPPACVASCPTGARVFGDLKDPKSTLSEMLRQRQHQVLRPDLGTDPKCYYIGLDQEVI